MATFPTHGCFSHLIKPTYERCKIKVQAQSYSKAKPRTQVSQRVWVALIQLLWTSYVPSLKRTRFGTSPTYSRLDGTTVSC